MINYQGTGSAYCDKCGKPFIYVGDVPLEGFPKGHAPWCECGTWDLNPAQYWKHCPHCGKELK